MLLSHLKSGFVSEQLLSAYPMSIIQCTKYFRNPSSFPLFVLVVPATIFAVPRQFPIRSPIFLCLLEYRYQRHRIRSNLYFSCTNYRFTYSHYRHDEDDESIAEQRDPSINWKIASKAWTWWVACHHSHGPHSYFRIDHVIPCSYNGNSCRETWCLRYANPYDLPSKPWENYHCLHHANPIIIILILKLRLCSLGILYINHLNLNVFVNTVNCLRAQ